MSSCGIICTTFMWYLLKNKWKKQTYTAWDCIRQLLLAA